MDMCTHATAEREPGAEDLVRIVLDERTATVLAGLVGNEVASSGPDAQTWFGQLYRAMTTTGGVVGALASVVEITDAHTGEPVSLFRASENREAAAAAASDEDDDELEG